MIAIIQVGLWTSTVIGVVLLLLAVLGRAPRSPVLVLAGLAEFTVVVGILVNVVMLLRGHAPPDLITHISYLLTIPFIIPLGVGLTSRKIDRWGLLIIAVACLVTAVLVVRQLQTLGVVDG